MAKTTRHSKRQRQKAKRKAERRKARGQNNGQKAGSIAIHSRLPGLEGIEIGEMDVVVDTRRQEHHESLITVTIHQRTQQRAIIWSIETGFGGNVPQVGYQVIPDGTLDDAPPTNWFADLDTVEPFIDIAPDEDIDDQAQEAEAVEGNAEAKAADQEQAA